MSKPDDPTVNYTATSSISLETLVVRSGGTPGPATHWYSTIIRSPFVQSGCRNMCGISTEEATERVESLLSGHPDVLKQIAWCENVIAWLLREALTELVSCFVLTAA